MIKYKIEDNVDFFKELNEELNKEINTEINIDNEYCLISGEILTENFIELECKHKFNYLPIYTELCLQKFRTTMNNCNYKHSNNNIFVKCPYCRHYQDKLLPYYEDMNLNIKLIYGINSYDKNDKVLKIINGKLIFENTVIPFKGDCCYNENGFECKNHDVLLHKELNQSYCLEHMKYIKKQYLLNKKKMEKNKIKMEKNKIKMEKNKIKKEVITNKVFCSQILKNGINKGKMCGCKAVVNDKCKRHSENTDNSIDNIIDNTIN